MAVTIGRLAEEVKKLLDGAEPPAASSISYNEMKIAIGQVCNALLKVDYFNINIKMGDMIPSGSVVGTYENIPVVRYKNKSKVQLPAAPLKLPRDMGVYQIFPSGEPDRQFIPIEMGQFSLLQSQPLINDILGQVGYERYGMDVIFTRDITIPGENVTVDVRLIIMDISLYDDYDPLPILPEMEWEIKRQVYQLYSTQPIGDKLVDPTVKENKGVPLKEQTNS